MKKLTFLSAALVFTAAACTKAPPLAEVAPEPGPELSTPAPAPRPSEKPAPAPTPAPAPAPLAVATPEPSYLAPEGVFFLTAKVSIETADGIVGYPPGTKIVRAGSQFLTADGRKIAPAAHQMTNDLRLAQRHAGLDAAAQEAVKNALVAQAAEIRVRPAAVAPPAMPGAAPTNPAAALNGPKAPEETMKSAARAARAAQFKQMESQREAVEREMTKAREEIGKLKNQSPKTSPTALRLTKQLEVLEERMRVIDEQETRVRMGR